MEECRSIDILNQSVKILEYHTIVVGSGAAGFNAADCLRQQGINDMAMVTEDRNGGTSRNTGSDKQTYYKLSLAGEQSDSIEQVAKVLFQGGCVDGDHALVEAALSCQGFFKLAELGVPFPRNRYGEYVGYKTDHDPNMRGTSAGPYTSRYMTEVLEHSVLSKQIPILDHHQVVKLLCMNEKIYGILCLNLETGDFVLIKCTNVVYATGGPACIYKDSVYPVSQFGATGLALEAGAIGKNMTEWQYGLASLHPRWNVSGSYMQVLPAMVSTDQDGNDSQEFLMEYFTDRYDMMNMIFLKGYQWPFDVKKVNRGSSIIDLLVYRETCLRGRRVWMDFRQNPGGSVIDFAKLSCEAADYLNKAGACDKLPVNRLKQLNALALDFYKEHGVDLEKEPLEIAVCAQHNNGGLSVDSWWRSNLSGFFAAGEAAATHGVYRPGGSALSAGQAGSARAAAYIGAHREDVSIWNEDVKPLLISQAEACIAMGMRNQNAVAGRRELAGKRMSHCGAMVRHKEEMVQALSETRLELDRLKGGKNESLWELSENSANGMSQVYRYYDMLLCQFTYLSAMVDYLEYGGSDRGSAVYRADGENLLEVHDETIKSLEGMIQEGRYHLESGSCTFTWRPVRQIPVRDDFFEVVWKGYRENKNMI